MSERKNKSIWNDKDIDFQQTKRDIERAIRESPNVLALMAASLNQMVDHEAIDRELSKQRRNNGRTNLF